MTEGIHPHDFVGYNVGAPEFTPPATQPGFQPMDFVGYSVGAPAFVPPVTPAGIYPMDFVGYKTGAPPFTPQPTPTITRRGGARPSARRPRDEDEDLILLM
jgi:hypothetical protein